MAGILDKKTRMFDTIVTAEGRSQIAAGNLRVEFATFTDTATFYVSGSNSVAESAQERIYIEAASYPKDTIIAETDSEGRFGVFQFTKTNEDGTSSGSFSMMGGNIYASGTTATLSGSMIAEGAESLLSSSARFFEAQHILGTRDVFDRSVAKQFELSANEVNFTLTHTAPYDIINDGVVVSIDDVEALMFDARFAEVPTFKFMPPVFKESAKSTVDEDATLGIYTDINEAELSTFSDVEAYLDGKEYADIEFTTTSRDNNILSQMIETSDTGVTRIKAVDFGEFENTGSASGVSRVMFLGKPYRDNNGLLTFVNLFTLVYE